MSSNNVNSVMFNFGPVLLSARFLSQRLYTVLHQECVLVSDALADIEPMEMYSDAHSLCCPLLVKLRVPCCGIQVSDQNRICSSLAGQCRAAGSPAVIMVANFNDCIAPLSGACNETTPFCAALTSSFFALVMIRWSPGPVLLSLVWL